MANIYGTKQYEDYLKKYDKFIRDKAKDKYLWTLTETIIKKYQEYEARLEVYRQNYLFEECNTLIERADLVIEKNGKQIYHCDNMYYHRELLYFYHYNRQNHLLFRKNDLYGYTLLNLETLEEYTYFPDTVINEHESFIITDAHIFQDILICEGCIWACPYTCYLIDLKTHKTFGIWRTLYNSKACVQIKDDRAVIVYEDEEQNPEPVSYHYEELKNLLEQSNSFDLDI